jgi:cysteine-rich repeat protein
MAHGDSMQPTHLLRANRRPAVGAAALLLALAVPAAAWGHGTRLPFADWGGFGVGSTRCQRVIARAAAQCAESTWRARRACRRAELAGDVCDQDTTQSIVTAARISALDTIDRHCSELQAIDLQYLGTFDLQEDVIRFCRAWDTAAVSAVYGPFPGSVPPAPRACIEAAADATDSVMHFVFRTRRQCMDRIASLPLQAANRTTLLEVAGHRMSGKHDALVARLAARCGAGAFTALYGRTPETFVADLAARADCIGGALYIQDAVRCPAAVCGNAVVELPEETCDDGNTSDGDACPSTCRQS